MMLIISGRYGTVVSYLRLMFWTPSPSAETSSEPSLRRPRGDGFACRTWAPACAPAPAAPGSKAPVAAAAVNPNPSPRKPRRSIRFVSDVRCIVATPIYTANAAGSRSRSRDVERSRCASICALQIGDLLLGGGDGVGAGDEAARRRLLAGDRDQRSRELGRVAGLLAVLGFPKLAAASLCARRSPRWTARRSSSIAP